MASLIDGLKDLLKYKIISNVSTGDKTQDNLVNTVLQVFLHRDYNINCKFRQST